MKIFGKLLLSFLLTVNCLPGRTQTVFAEDNPAETDELVLTGETEETEEFEEIPETEELPETEEITEPEETEEPAVTEVPEETEITEEDPEITETEEETVPAETEEPEEITEETEEPEEVLEEPAETPEPEEIPEPAEEEETPVVWEEIVIDESDPFSEPVSAHMLDEDASAAEITSVAQNADNTITVKAVWRKSPAPSRVVLIAENEKTRYYLAAKEYPSVNSTFSFSNVSTFLPEGEYTLRMGAVDEDAAKPTLRVSAKYSVKLLVLPTPNITAVRNDDTYYTGEIEVKVADLTYVYQLVFEREGSIWATVSASDLENYSEKGIFTKGGLPHGNYQVYYEGLTKGMVISCLSVPANVSIGLAVTPAAIYASVMKNGVSYGDPTKPLVLDYKGEKAQIDVWMYPDLDVTDRRVKFTSGNTKVVTVDAVGNITAVGKGETEITITSVAAPYVKKTVSVKVDPATPKTMKFDSSKLSGGLSLNYIYNVILGYQTYPVFDLKLTTTGLPDTAEVPVTYTVTGGDGLKVYSGTGSYTSPGSYENPHVGTSYMSYSGLLRNNTASIKLMAFEGGVYTVTASALGKTASSTITVNGFDNLYIHSSVIELTQQSKLYYDGKPVTGWVRTAGDSYYFGNEALADIEGNIIYIDPSTKLPITAGIHKIGKKAYLFRDSGELSNSYLDKMDTTPDGRTVSVLPDASLWTGWQEVDMDNDNIKETLAYFDPSTYLMATKAWVPVRSGSGYTWVDEYGLCRDDYGYSLDNLGAFEVDGFHQIDSKWYVFAGGYKKSARQTGWVYFKTPPGEPYKLELTDAKSAVYKFYCDPNRNGRVKEKTFWVDGKEYRGEALSSAYPEGKIFLPGNYALAATGEKNVKYMAVGSSGYLIGPDGSVVKNTMVSAWDYYHTPYGVYSMYADEQGYYATDEWITYKNKTYYFDSKGHLATDHVSTEFYVSSGGSYKGVQAKYTDKTGYTYYTSDVSKLTNIVLYRYVSSKYIPYLVLDKNGRQVYDAVVKAKDSVGGTLSVRLVDTNGRIIRGDEDNYDATWFKDKLYALDQDGHTAPAGAVKLGEESYPVLGCAGKDGILVRNAIAKVTVNGHEYSVYFDSDGESSSPSTVIVVVGDKAYVTKTAEDKWYGKNFRCISRPEKAGWSSGPDGLAIYINKDGSLKTGLLTRPDGTRTYYLIRDGWFDTLQPETATYGPALWKIGGKIYCFNDASEMITGWVYFDKAVITDVKTDKQLTVLRDAMMYFDPKTGAAAAGGWKTVPLPLADRTGISYGSEDLRISDSAEGDETYAVNNAGSNAKLYFTSDGKLVRNTELKISGKTYLFGADGTSKYKAGWTDADCVYYITSKGVLATGRQKIDGQYYYFDETGRKQTDRLIKTGNKWYYYNNNGIQTTPVLAMTPSNGILNGSETVDLTAVWAKDGSLTKITYTINGNPAAGETVNFGFYDDDFGIYNSFLLDSKGLPKTGVVPGVMEDGFENTYVYLPDGKKASAGNSGYYNLLKEGKTYYLMDDIYVMKSLTIRAVAIDGSCDKLEGAAAKSFEFFSEQAYNKHTEVYVLVNPDGSVVADQAVYATVNGLTQIWHTTSLGIPVDYYSTIYRFKGKWYVSDAQSRNLHLYGDSKPSVDAQIRTKTNGELIGFYDESTGKALTGIYSNESWYISLKNGKPQTGLQKGMYRDYWFDPDCGTYHLLP